jgi:hypothetical protein
MTILGWIFLTASTAFVWGLSLWCFYKVLTSDHEEKVTAPPAGLGP